MDALLPCRKDKFMFSNTFQEQGRKECSFLLETAVNLKVGVPQSYFGVILDFKESTVIHC